MVLGPMAAGKSTLCMRLAAQFNLPLVSRDVLLASALQDCSSRAG
jgi:adenylate kinase family enzyme